ncbi:Rim21p NDAI_0A06100 [Naumovozyma dairenensis CBS 421]|uniref:pH-response regulator protein palH/RIM21 n=1 Tax=Naumovozyma dairenensis (strain ATCC 10597 / BCRC 20456 / CBS 421 / NBRC 0211 / NRRL Y-12639) TaxID=1071378 RepID=G0W4M7_NAUDC|nr:hypothetical protein NDAI_0A06100 [Naumovozyma dairenensis CBS 421]CCD22765.1 hypothetical protein NDAI_0A06100 [Naumovozyma dairenensis CBS 421]
MTYNNIWRLSPTDPYVYKSCNWLDLGPGLLVNDNLDQKARYIASIKFKSYCDGGSPVYMASRLTGLSKYRYLDSVYLDWKKYITANNSIGGSFQYSIYSVVISFTANLVITIFLTVLVFINIRDKPYVKSSRLLKFASLIASLNLIIFVTRSLQKLATEHKTHGTVSTHYAMDLFTDDIAFIVLDFISTCIFQLCQVSIVIRLFERIQEKRIVFICGVCLTIVDNVLWVIPQLVEASGGGYVKRWEILPPFVYLFRISIATSYACVVISYIIRKRRQSYRSFQMVLLSFLTLITVIASPVFFIIDISDVWISELSEIFSTTCYIGATVIVWEYLDRLSVIERNDRAQSVLGRPIFEDEQHDYNFAKYALKVQKALIRSDSNTGSEAVGDEDLEEGLGNQADSMDNNVIHPEDESINQVRFDNKREFNEVAQEHLSNAIDKVLYFTDQIAIKSFGNYTSNSSSKNSDNSNERKKVVKRRLGLDKPKDVYVYELRDVVFPSDDEEEEEEEEEERKVDKQEQRNEEGGTYDNSATHRK